jgi:xanthine dehydrogenase accessory factor
MAIAADGRFQGSVSGGCIEGEVITAAEDVLADGRPRTLAFGVADETAWNVGLPCGGEVSVFIERLERPAGGELLERALAAGERRQGLIVRTNLTSGRKELLTGESPGLPPALAQRLRSGESRLEETTDGKVFTQALLPPARIVVVGATHIAQILCSIARQAGYEIRVVDPRTAFASPARFPGVSVSTEWPEAALPAIGLDAYTAVVVLAHVAHIDDEALKVALRQDCLYIGALGSSRNHAKRRERLKAAGFTDAELARIKSPIGLSINAQSPAEIALSVMAEIVSYVRGPKSMPKTQAAAE